METIYENKISFLKRNPNHIFYTVIISLLILLIIGYYSLKTEVYHHYLTKGFVNCDNKCTITSYIPTTFTVAKILVNDENYELTILSKTLEIDEEKMISYYKTIFEVENDFTTNEIVDLNFYYNKQSIFQKMTEKLFN